MRGSDTGDYLVRNILGVDPHNHLVAIGEYVEPGDELLFCRRDQQSAEADLLLEVRTGFSSSTTSSAYCASDEKFLNVTTSLFGFKL